MVSRSAAPDGITTCTPSQPSYQKIGPNRFEIQEFGGVIFAMANRNDINSVQDIKDKSYAAASSNNLGSGLAQFHEMVKKGISTTRPRWSSRTIKEQWSPWWSKAKWT